MRSKSRLAPNLSPNDAVPEVLAPKSTSGARRSDGSRSLRGTSMNRGIVRRRPRFRRSVPILICRSISPTEKIQQTSLEINVQELSVATTRFSTALWTQLIWKSNV
jgi:hypothetical protein